MSRQVAELETTPSFGAATPHTLFIMLIVIFFFPLSIVSFGNVFKYTPMPSLRDFAKGLLGCKWLNTTQQRDRQRVIRGLATLPMAGSWVTLPGLDQGWGGTTPRQQISTSSQQAGHTNEKGAPNNLNTVPASAAVI